jgi:uncharacterized membrane protein YraQ (UPF0718 family)
MTWYELLNLTDIPDYARYMIIGIILAAFHDLLASLINDDTLQISQVVPTCGGFVSATAAGTCISPCQHGNAEIVSRFWATTSTSGGSRSTRSTGPFVRMLVQSR